MNGVSLFSSSGIGELFLYKNGIKIKVANELIKRRADLYKIIHKDSSMIWGDINDKKIFDQIINNSKKEKCKFLIATPPCQGFSLAGKNKNLTEMQLDERNYLFLKVIDLVKTLQFDYIIIENVPRFLQLVLPYKGNLISPEEILNKELGEIYKVDVEIYNSAEYSIPQSRKRAIIKIYKKNLKWPPPKKHKKEITIREAIGHLPPLESGEKSKIKWHFARVHSESHILTMKHTPEGKSAFQNKKYFPKTKDGLVPKGFATTYSRLKWDEPCPTITMRNDAISSQRNVHPGRKLKDGTFSDARVLTIKELFLLTGLGDNFDLPNNTSEILIRQIIGECVPPGLIYELTKSIKK
jgi:DNA (cytosine-5)-methyltransferase 1